MDPGRTRTPRRTSIKDIGEQRVADFLAKTALFRSLDPEVARRLTPHLEVADYGTGDAVRSLDASGRGLCFIASGRARVTSGGGASHEIGVGDVFNEAMALTGTAMLSMVALEPCRVLEIGHAALEQLLAKVPAFATSLAVHLAEQIGQSGQAAAAAPVAGSSSGVQFASTSDFTSIEAALELVPLQLVHQYRMLPLEIRGNTLTVGMVDPLDRVAQRELARVLHTAMPTIVAISADDFANAVRRLRLDNPATAGRGGRIPASSIVFDELDTERPDASMRAVGDQVVKLAAEVIAAGLERHASDIHIESEKTSVRIRFRVNGALSDWGQEVPAYMAKALIARFKVLGGLDITERRRPQDGRVGVRVGNRDVDLRVSTLPATSGEKLVMRVFEASQMLQGLEQIFTERRTLEAVRAAIDRPYGAVVVAGPTGSGKSSTLYAAMHERRRARSDTNILTVEDPVEYRLEGVTQVQVNPAIDLGFAPILRSMLRQDPDVVMVGEVRDSETAHLALEASMTGHLMLTSIHANDALSVVQRFENLGCSRSEVAQSLALVIVQRLARRLCPQCTKNEPAPAILIETLEARRLFDSAKPTPLPRASGCEACDNTGLAGRIAVVESLVVDDELRATLMAERSLGEVAQAAQARGSLIRFYQYARHLMHHGLISPAEALLAVAN